MSDTRATITSTVADPETIAAAIAPDNTDDVETTVTDGQVVTTMCRDRTASLEATVDDYVLNLAVATDVARIARQQSDRTASEPTPSSDTTATTDQ